MQIDFVKVPYSHAPSMSKNTGTIFNTEPNLEILKKKKLELEKFGTDLYGQVPGLNKTVAKAAEYCNVYSDNIVDLALRLEEDVAVLHQGKLAAICFCFPSGFKPSEKIGMSLGDIHLAVADGELLVKASPGIVRVMTEQKSFRRHIWTITANSKLSNHPSNRITKLPESIDELYFRYETQTTARVDDDTSLFFVKVDVIPLKTVYCQKILDSVNSMSNKILEYKNLTNIKNLLNSLDVKDYQAYHKMDKE